MRSLCDLTGLPYQVVTRTLDHTKNIFDQPDADIRAIDSAEDIVEIARSGNASLVILDPPYAQDRADELTGPFWQSTINKIRQAGMKVARFTDESIPTQHQCDLLVNDHPNSAAFGETYKKMVFEGRLLLGPSYFLIDPQHRALNKKAQQTDDELFVSFGGSDQLGIVDRLLPGLQKISDRLSVHLVVGAGHPSAIPQSAGLKISKGLPPREFAVNIRKSRMVLTGAGNTLFERAYHGTPGLCVSQSAHQETIGIAFERLGTTEYIGRGDQISSNFLVQSVIELWNDDEARRRQGQNCGALEIHRGCDAIIDAVRSLA